MPFWRMKKEWGQAMEFCQCFVFPCLTLLVEWREGHLPIKEPDSDVTIAVFPLDSISIQYFLIQNSMSIRFFCPNIWSHRYKLVCTQRDRTRRDINSSALGMIGLAGVWNPLCDFLRWSSVRLGWYGARIELLGPFTATFFSVTLCNWVDITDCGWCEGVKV